MTGPEARRDTDLERIEAALADGRATAGDPRERELQELALALRAEAPEPEPRFATELDRRVAEGFEKPKRRGLFALPGGWVTGLAGATALLLVAVIGLNALDGGSGEPAGPVAAQQPLDEAAPSPTAPGGAQTLTEPPSTASADGRRVERSARITLTAPEDDLQRAADGIGTVAESHRGFVLSSQFGTGDQGSPGGSFVLRVPARELQATLSGLSELGHVSARSESAQDMTAPYRDVQDKLGELLLERRALKLKLRRADGAKADTIRTRIASLNAQIQDLSGRMHDLRDRTVFSTVDVTLSESRGDSGGGAGFGGAWDDSLGTLEALGTFFVRALGVLIPLALLSAIAAAAARTLRRRRREAPLL